MTHLSLVLLQQMFTWYINAEFNYWDAVTEINQGSEIYLKFFEEFDHTLEQKLEFIISKCSVWKGH